MPRIDSDSPKDPTRSKDAVELIPECLRVMQVLQNHDCECYVDGVILDRCVFETTSARGAVYATKFYVDIRFNANILF